MTPSARQHKQEMLVGDGNQLESWEFQKDHVVGHVKRLYQFANAFSNEHAFDTTLSVWACGI
jgi:hypothetical protein